MIYVLLSSAGLLLLLLGLFSEDPVQTGILVSGIIVLGSPAGAPLLTSKADKESSAIEWHDGRNIVMRESILVYQRPQ